MIIYTFKAIYSGPANSSTSLPRTVLFPVEQVSSVPGFAPSVNTSHYHKNLQQLKNSRLSLNHLLHKLSETVLNS